MTLHFVSLFVGFTRRLEFGLVAQYILFLEVARAPGHHTLESWAGEYACVRVVVMVSWW